MKERLQKYPSQRPLRENLGVEYPFHGIMTGSDQNFEFPLNRSEDTLSLAAECHLQLRTSIMSHHLDEASTGDNDQRYVTFKKLSKMLGKHEEWRPLHNTVGNNSKHNKDTREAFVADLFAQSADENVLDLLYDVRFVSERSQFCPDDSKISTPLQNYFNGHRKVQFKYQEQQYGTIREDSVEDFKGYDFDFYNKAVGNYERLCPCSNHDLSVENTCGIGFEICAMHLMDKRKCFAAACEAAQVSSETNITYQITTECSVGYVREFLKAHAEALSSHNFVCDSFMPSNLWGLDFESNDIHDMRSMLILKNGISVKDVADTRRQVALRLHEGLREVNFSSTSDPKYTVAHNILCSNQYYEQEFLARFAFPAVSFLSESKAVITCTAYVMEHTYSDFLEEFTADENVQAEFEDVIELSRSRAQKLKSQCDSLLERLETCEISGAFDKKVVRSVSAQAQHSSCCTNRNYDLSQLDAQNVATYCIKHECTVAVMFNPVQYFNISQCEKSSAGAIVLAPACRRVGMRCPFTYEGGNDDEYSFLPAPCLVVKHAPNGRDEFYDPALCVSSQPNPMQNPIIMYKSWFTDDCRIQTALDMLTLKQDNQVGVYDLPRLSQNYVTAVLDSRNSKLRSGFFGTSVDEDWWEPQNTSKGWFPMPTIPYWPAGWQGAPHGELLADATSPASGLTFSTYMAFVEGTDTPHFAILPEHLRFENHSTQLFGSSGFCREPTWGMPMEHMNLHRFCIIENNTDQLEQTLCTDSSSVHLGGAMHHSLGHWWGLLFPFLQEDFTLTADNQIAIENLFSINYDSSFLKPEHGRELETVVDMFCQDDYGIHGNAHHFETPNNRCYHNADCAENEVCAGDTGTCTAVKIGFSSNQVHEVEVGVYSKHCQGQGKYGASPYESVQGLLHLHGMCSHNNYVNYRYLLQRARKEDSCEQHVVNNHTYYECDRNLVFYWLTQNPLQLPKSAAPGVFAEQYDASNVEETFRKVKENGLFELEPSACDYEYAVDSDELRWCTLNPTVGDVENVQDLPPAKWMRMNLPGRDTFVFMDSDDMFNEIKSVEPYTSVYDRTTELLRNKLRFMGLDENEIITNPFPANTLANTCGKYGMCQSVFLSVSGQRRLRRKFAGVEFNAHSDLKLCHSFGYVEDDACNNDPITCRCVLDTHVNALFYTLYSQETGADCDFIRPQVSTDLRNNGTHWTYGPENVYKVQSFLQKLFFYTSTPAPHRDEVKSALYTQVHQCCTHIQNYLNNLNTIRDLYPDKLNAEAVLEKKSDRERLVEKTQGVYFFYDYAAQEVPVLWFLKMKYNPLFFDYNIVYPDLSEELIRLPSFDNRLELVELANSPTTGIKVKNIWADTILRADALVKDNIMKVFNMAFGREYDFFLKNESDISYSFRQPTHLSLSKPTVTDDHPADFGKQAFVKLFEAIAHEFHYGEPTFKTNIKNKLRDDEIAEAMKPMKEYTEPFISRFVKSENIHESNMKSLHSENLTTWNAIDDNYQSWFELAIGEYLGLKITLISPFDRNFRDQNVNDLIRDFENNTKMLKIAQFDFSIFDDTDDALANRVHTENTKILEQLNEDVPFQLPIDLENDIFDSNQTMLADTCIYNHEYFESMYREASTYGVFRDSNPEVKIRTDANPNTCYRTSLGDAHILRTISLCDADSNKYREYRTHGGDADGMPCNFNRDATMDYVDFDPNTIPQESTLRVQMERNFASSDDHMFYREDKKKPIPERIGVAGAFLRKYISQSQYHFLEENRRFDKTHAICHRLDLHCVTEDNNQTKEILWNDIHDWKHDTYARIEHNAYTQASPEKVRDETPCNPYNSPTECAKKRVAKWAYATEETDLNIIQSFETEKLFKELGLHDRLEAIKDTNDFCLHSENLGNMTTNDFKITYYKIHDHFKEHIRNHSQGLGILTSKDRLYTEISRTTSAHSQKQPVFGHFEGLNNKKVIPTPGYSFCPGVVDETNDDFKYLHYYKLVDYTNVGKTRLNNKIYNAKPTNDEFWLTGFAVPYNRETEIRQAKFSDHNQKDETETTTDQFYDLETNFVSEFRDTIPIQLDDCANFVKDNDSCRPSLESSFSQKLRQLLFTKFSFSDSTATRVDFNDPLKMWDRSTTPRLINPAIHHREVKLKYILDSPWYLDGYEFAQRAHVDLINKWKNSIPQSPRHLESSSWPVMFPWRKRGNMKPDRDEDGLEITWQNLDYLICDVKYQIDLEDPGMKETVQTWYYEGWCPRYSGTNERKKFDCISGSGMHRNGVTFRPGYKRLATENLNTYKEYVCEDAGLEFSNSLSEQWMRLTFDVQKYPPCQLTWNPATLCVNCAIPGSASVTASGSPSSEPSEPQCHSITPKPLTFTYSSIPSLFQTEGFYGLIDTTEGLWNFKTFFLSKFYLLGEIARISRATFYNFWTNVRGSEIDNLSDEEYWFLSEESRAKRRNERNFFDEINCAVVTDSVPSYVLGGSNHKIRAKRKCRGEMNALDTQNAGSIAWPFVAEYNPQKEFPHVARVGWQPHDPAIEDKSFWSDYIQHDHYFPFYSELLSEKSPPDSMKRPYASRNYEDRDYVYYNTPETGDKFEIGMFEQENIMHHHFNYLPVTYMLKLYPNFRRYPYEEQLKMSQAIVVNEVAHVLNDKEHEVVRFTADVDTGGIKMKNYNTDNTPPVEYTRSRLDAQAGRSTFQHSQRAQTGTTGSGVSAPCNLPRFNANNKNIFEFDYLDIANCYEHDIHEIPNWRPWWSYSTCDMGRGILDQTTNYYALSEWLDWDMPQHFTLNFLTDFVSTFVNAMYRGYYATEPDGRESGWVPFDNTGIHKGTKDRHGNEMTHQHVDVQHPSKASIENHFQERDEFYMRHGMGKAPRESGTNENTDFWHYLFGHQRTESEKAWGPLRLSGKLLGDNLMNSFARYIMSENDHCAITHESDYVFTKPTKWSEIDGAPGKHLVPCIPSGTGDTECLPLIVPVLENENGIYDILSDDIIVSYSIEQGKLFCFNSQYQDFNKDPRPRYQHEMPFWVNGIEESERTDKEGLWVRRTCKKFAEGEDFMKLRRENTMMAGVWKQDQSQYTLMTRKSNEMVDDLSDEKHGLKKFLAEETLLASLNARLESVYGQNVYKLYKTDDGHSYELYLNYLDLENKVNSTDEIIIREYNKYFINQTIVDSFLSMSGNEDQQYCKKSGAQVQPFCQATRYDAQKTLTHNMNIEEKLIENCQQSKDLHGEDVLADFFHNFTLLQRVRNMTETVLKQKYGLDVHRLRSSKQREFYVNDTNFSWTTDGIHVFVTKAVRDQHEKFLENLLSNINLERTWEDTSTDEKTCFVTASGKITVVNPWFGGNYTFPIWSKLQNPRTGQLHLEQTDDMVLRLMTGFDLCPSHHSKNGKNTAGDLFSWSTTWPCHASECVNYDLAQVKRGLNATDYTICDALGLILNDTTRLNWPRYELLKKDAESSMVYFTNPEYFHTSIADYDVCKQTPNTDRVCHHTQTVLGRTHPETHTAFKRAKHLTKQKMDGRIQKHVFTLSTNMTKTLWNTKTVKQALNTISGSDNAFTLLMDPQQTGPRKILFQLTNTFLLYLNEIHLTEGGEDMAIRWQEDAASQMQKDESKIHNNKLYSGRKRQVGQDRNWVCPLLKMDLFSFHEGLYEQHKQLRLLTPDPVKMKEKYPTLSGMHPMVQTEDLHQMISRDTRKRYRRLGPAFLFEETTNTTLRQSTWDHAKRHLQNMIDNIILSKNRLQYSVHRGPVPRHHVPDWPNLPKTMRSGEQHDPGVQHVVNLLPLEPSAYYVKMDKMVGQYPRSFQNTHAAGGDCFRNSTIVFNASELERVLSYDLCYQTFEHPNHLKCSKTGDHEYTFLPIRRRDPMISRNNTDIQALFATPMVVKPKSVLTKLYRHKSSPPRDLDNELSLSSRVRLSPKYRIWMRLKQLNFGRPITFQEMQTKWLNTENVRVARDRWRAVDTFQNTSNDYFKCANGNKLTILSGLSATSRQEQCRNYMDTQSCSEFPSIAINICLVSLFGDYCKILAQWTSDVNKILAAQSGLLSVTRQVYVPSMFHTHTSSFVHQHVIASYENIDAAGVQGAKMCAVRVDTDSTAQRNRECPANFYARLIETLGLLHDFGLLIWDFVLDMYQLAEEFFTVILSFIIESLNGGERVLSFPTIPQSFAKMVRHLIRIIDQLITMYDKIFNAIWEMIKAAPFWNNIEDLIHDICGAINDIIDWVEGIVNDIISAINSAASWIGLSLNIGQVTLGKIKCELTLHFITEAFDAEDVSVTSTYCHSNIQSVQSFDEFGSTSFTRDSCNSNSFCVNDAFDSNSVIKCGECPRAAYHCDLLVKSCKCGIALDTPAKTCTVNRDCQGSAQCLVLHSPWQAESATMPCGENQGQVVCVRQPTRDLADLGQCAILRQRSMSSYSDCVRGDKDQLTTFIQSVTSGGFCLISSLDTTFTSLLFDNLAVMPCHKLVGKMKETECTTVHVNLDAFNKFVTQYSNAPLFSGRRLLQTDTRGSKMVLQFLQENIDRVSSRESTCFAAAISCLSSAKYTTECMSCARTWWFWNMTLHNSGRQDTEFMDARYAMIEMLTNKTLGRQVIAKTPEVVVHLMYDWLDDERAWAVLARYLPQAFGQRWFVIMRQGVENLNQYYALVQHAPRQDTKTPSQQRKLLQTESHRDFGVTPPDVNATMLARELRTYYYNNKADTKLNLNINVRQAQRPLQCTKNSYAFNGDFLVRFQTLLTLNGYSPLVECSGVEAEELGTCPLVMAPFLEVVKDTTTLLEYYAHMQKSGCIYDSKKSCLKEPKFKAANIIQVIPKIASVENTTTNIGDGIDLNNQGIVLWIVLKLGNFVLDIFKPLFGDSRGHLLGFLQIDSFKNNTVFYERTRTNTWDVGRIVRELTDCNFEEILHCNRVRSPLPMTVVGMFIFIMTIHIFIPIHPVLSFFIWTGALTWGVPFLAYGFSPLCLPRIPVCYASDVHDFVNWVVPTHMSVPHNLYNASCAPQKLAFNSDCLLSCDNLNVRVYDAMSIIYMLEPASTRGSTFITRKVFLCCIFWCACCVLWFYLD